MNGAFSDGNRMLYAFLFLKFILSFGKNSNVSEVNFWPRKSYLLTLKSCGDDKFDSLAQMNLIAWLLNNDRLQTLHTQCGFVRCGLKIRLH